ncbi:MAG TPA: hypothetical protein VFH17_03825, partial [Coriobacteriia bacterium]|nr:hypothetical protein [Coriobacteriia bacterium]
MAEPRLGAVFTARDEASKTFKTVSTNLQKLGIDAKKAADLTKQSWVQGFDNKNLNTAQKSLQRLGLSSKDAAGALRDAGVGVKDVEQATAKATASASKFRVSLSGIGSSIGNLGRQMTVASALIVAPFVAAATWAGKLAIESVETANLYKVSMGTMESAGTRFIGQMSTAYGLNTRALQQNLGMFQSWFTSMGFGAQTAYGMSTALTKLSYDFSSFFNVAPEEAFTKIQSAMAGETEAVRRWGIDVSDAAVKTYALKNGLAASSDELSQAQKAWIRYALLLEQSKNAQGDLARTMESPANQLRLLKERVTALATEVGQNALPVISSALTWLNDTALPRVRAGLNAFGDSWAEMSEVAKRRVIAIAALFVAGGPLLTAFGVAIRGLGMVGAGFKLLASFALGRFALIVAGIGLAVEAVYQMRNALVGLMEEQGRTLVKQAQYWQEVARLTNQPLLGVYAAGMEKVGSELIPNLAQSARGAMPAVEGLHDKLIQMGSDALTGGFDDLAASAEQLGGNILADASRAFDEWANYSRTIKSDAEYMREAAREAGAGLAEYVAPEIDKAAFASLASGLGDTAKKAKEADVSVKDLTAALIAIHPATRAAAAAVAYWDGQIASVNLALDANKDQLQAAQAELGRMQDRLSDLSGELTTAKQRLDDFARPRLTGMGDLETQINAVQDALKRMDLADATGQDFGAILSQYPLLAKGAAAYLATLPQTREGLDAQLKTLQALQAVKYDEKLRLLGAAAEDSRLEMPYEQAMAGVIAYKARVSDLTGAIASQEAAIRGQEGVVKSLNAAQDALNRTLQGYQEQLTLAKANQDAVVSGLQQAFQWILADREEIQKLGPAGVAAAQKVDAETIKLLTGLSEFAETNTTTNQLQVNAMQTAYESAVEQIKAQLASIPKEFEVKVKVTTEQIASAAGSTGIPQFASGGTVPGPIGSPTLAVVHGGEYVVPVGGSRSA